MDLQKAQHHFVAIVGVVLLALYALPLWAATLALLQNHLNGETTAGRSFMSVLTGGSGPIAFNRLFLPLMAGGTVAFLWSYARGVWGWVLGGLTLLSLVCVFLLWRYLADEDHALNLWQPIGAEAADTPTEFATLSNSYLGGMAEGLATYLFVMLGLTFKAGSN